MFGVRKTVSNGGWAFTVTESSIKFHMFRICHALFAVLCSVWSRTEEEAYKFFFYFSYIWWNLDTNKTGVRFLDSLPGMTETMRLVCTIDFNIIEQATWRCIRAMLKIKQRWNYRQFCFWLWFSYLVILVSMYSV